MLSFIWRYFKGYLLIKIEGGSPERFINMCVYHHISLWDLESGLDSFTFKISIKELKQLTPILRKNRTHFHILKKYGMPFFLYRVNKRPLTLPGILLVILTVYLYTLFIWEINIEGNQRYSEEEIIEFVNGLDFYKSMKVSDVDEGELVYRIRSYFSDIIWVSVHVDGTTLNLRVKENEQIAKNDSLNVMQEHSENSQGETIVNQGKDLIAKYDGYIISIVTRSGIPQVHKGDYVMAGDILVSGRIEIQSDYEGILGYQYVEADADVIIETKIEYKDIEPIAYLEKVYEEFEKYSFYLKIGEYYIGNEVKNTIDKNYEIHTKELILHPEKQAEYTFILGSVTTKNYELIENIHSDDYIKAVLSERFSKYISGMKEKGVDIIENNVNIVLDGVNAVATGELIAHAMDTMLVPSEVLTIEEIELLNEENVWD